MRRTIISAILLAATLGGAAVAQETSVFRHVFPVPLLLGSSDGEVSIPDPLTIETGSLPIYATTGDSIAATVAISGGVPPYSTTLEGDSIPPLATITPSGLSGTFTAGQFSFSARVTDSASPAVSAPSLTTWNVEVADPVSVGSMPSNLDVTAGTPKSFALPTIAGGTAPFSYSIVPADARVSVDAGAIKVQASVAETITGLQVKVVDSRGRIGFSSAFTVTSSPATVLANRYDETQIASVTGGSTVKSATSRIHATAFSGKSGTFATLPALRLPVGTSTTVTYNGIVSATRVYISLLPPVTACDNSTPNNKFQANQPVFDLETSIDGQTWHKHTSDKAKYVTSSVHCGWSGNSMFLDSGHQTAKYVRLTLSSSKQVSGANSSMDIVALRLSY